MVSLIEVGPAGNDTNGASHPINSWSNPVSGANDGSEEAG